MAIKNPYPLEEHRTFKRTFLQQTEVTLRFTPVINDVDFRNRMLPYLKTVFNLDLTGKVDAEANHAEINSDNEQKKFVFDLNQAKFIIGPSSYNTFKETAIPMVGMLVRFIADVAEVEAIDELSVVKINIWPIKSEDAFSSFTNMIRYTFKESCVSDMLSYKFDDNPKPVRLSKTSDTTIAESVGLDAVLSAEVVSKEKVNLGLALNASARNIGINDILSDAITLNDIIYRGFIESVSENIIDFMSREKLS
jgi:hypothetical protein